MEKNKRTNMKKATEIVLRVLTFLGLIMVIIPFFSNLWVLTYENTIIGEYGLFSNYPEEVYELFNLGNVSFNTIGSTLTSVFSIVILVSILIYVIFSIISWTKVMKEKHIRIILKVTTLLMLISAIMIFIGGNLFIKNNFSIQMPLTDTYHNVYMSATISYYLILIGSIWSTIFGGLSLIRKKNKNK